MAHIPLRTGLIVRMVEGKGFGFIREDNTRNEYFFHRSACTTRFDELQVDDSVEFVEESSPKGPRAGQVTMIRRD